ncbi:ABC transporter permease [bacterium]|nr:ABC transporter permease [candidate division CSSED10-310 bacterium]
MSGAMGIMAKHNLELLTNLTVRNLKIKYKGSFLGFLWSLITPLLQMLIYTVVFSVIIRVQVDWPFAVFLLTAQLPWIFFSSSLTMGAGSVIEHANLVKKVYFPREMLPFATVLSNLIGFGITLLILAVFLIGYRIPITRYIILLPPAIFFLFLFTLGLTLITGCLAVFFRDIFHILEVVLLFWFWSVPVVYPLSLLKDLPESYQWFARIYKLNPMVEILELFRHAFLYESWPPLKHVLYAGIWSFAMTIAGYWMFKKLEPLFAREV